ncbi:MAG: hypothetical protein JW936_02905 [Sedimentisphaerales bacterium]|nr:hypothetical protein [Sedimentisphaerales bacterium]
MNGSLVKNLKTTNTVPALTLTIIVAAALALNLGCETTQTYDGRQSSDYARLTVENRTPWPCSVAITPADNHTNQSAIWAEIQSQHSFTWELVPGNYQLNAVAQDGAQFQNAYYAQPNHHQRWPIMSNQSPLHNN